MADQPSIPLIQAAAIAFTLSARSKLYCVDPHASQTSVLDRLAEHKINRVEDLVS
jgi:hypothetical protein